VRRSLLGLTHGSFYAHFASKQELQEVAIVYGQAVSLGRVQRSDTKKGQKSKRAYADQYLSPWHRDNPGDGCTMAALGQDVARSTPELKEVFERGLEEHLAAMGGNWKESHPSNCRHDRWCRAGSRRTGPPVV
jgi:TetR/AcrR family transcriptional regulator, transcriptional repressor for nem operon